MANTIKTLWFDLGNVILPFDFTPAFKALTRYTHLNAKQIRNYLQTHPTLEAELDEGKVHAYALYCELRRELGLSGLSYAAFKKIWNNIFKENRKVSELIRCLRKRKYRLILISNTNRLHFVHIKKRYPVLREFHKWVLSYEVRARKPHPKIFQTALKSSRARNHEIFYTDDRHVLTRAAKTDFGVHAHTFKGYSGLKKSLAAKGIQV